jgi:plastocyanin
VYQWFVFVHLAGVFGLLASHGVSMVVMFRLRTERDPARVDSLLQLSSSSITPFWLSTVVLLAGGIVAAFLGDLWGYGWIWGSIATLAVVTVAMFLMARPYYRRVRFVARALAEGSEAVTPQQFDGILRSGRPWAIAAVGTVGLGFILYLMLFKPTLGFSPGIDPAAAAGPAVRIAAEELSFSAERLEASAGEPFRIVLDNRASSVPHNLSVYEDDSRLAQGEIVTGPATVATAVPPLDAGEYRFVCDVHPDQMSGTLVVE